MRRIFAFEPDEYLITDELSLFDFTGVEEMDLSHIHQKIEEVYDLDVSDIPSGNLLEIFIGLPRRTYGAP